MTNHDEPDDTGSNPAVAAASGAAASGAAATTRAAAAARAAAATRAAAAAHPTHPAHPAHPATLAIDIGGTGLKASVLDADGKLMADRVRVATPYPCSPDKMVEVLVALVAPLPAYDRVSVGFPGVVRAGKVLTAPHFITKSGPGSEVVPKLAKAWSRFDLGGTLARSLDRPVRLANDADLQGAAVVSGVGLEFVVTLGTGVGTAVYLDGRLAPHLELAQHPFRKGQTYNEQLGDAVLQRIGSKRWRRRVDEAFANFHVLLNYDRIYVGGGNARRLAGHVGPEVQIVDNVAGILGGIKLWTTETP